MGFFRPLYLLWAATLPIAKSAITGHVSRAILLETVMVLATRKLVQLAAACCGLVSRLYFWQERRG